MEAHTVSKWFGNSSFFGGLNFPKVLTYAERYPERRPEVLAKGKRQAELAMAQAEFEGQQRLFSDTVERIGQRLKPENIAVLERESRKLQNGQRLVLIPLSANSNVLSFRHLEDVANDFRRIAFSQYKPMHEIPIVQRQIYMSNGLRENDVKAGDYEGFKREIESRRDPITPNNFDREKGTLFLDEHALNVIRDFKGNVAYVMLPKYDKSYIVEFGIVKLV